MCCVGMYCDRGRRAQICAPRINSRLMLWSERDKFARQRAQLMLSPNWNLEPLMLVSTRNDQLCFSIASAKLDSDAATKLQPKQKAGNKEKRYGKVQGKSNGRSKNSSSSGSVGKSKASVEDDTGTAQGFAMLAGLKAQLLQNSDKCKNLSEYSHPASNAEGISFPNKEVLKLPSPVYSRRKVKPSAENVAKKFFDSSIKRNDFGKPPSDLQIGTASFTHQSVDDQMSDIPSNLRKLPNILKEQARAGNIENQIVSITHCISEDKELSEIRELSNMEIDTDFKLHKAALPPPQSANHSLLKGQTILEAMQKASIERSKLTRRSKRVARKAKRSNENEFKGEDNYVGEVQPISINPEWASELERLGASLAALKKLL